MTGLEKMKARILDEAKQTAQEKLGEAEARAGEILDAAKAESEKESSGILQRAEAAAASIKERTGSSNDLARRTRILAAKQEVISDVLKSAYASVEQMDDEAYFSMLLKLLDRYVQPLAGEMYLSAADLKRLPADFSKQVDAVAKAKGGSLKVAGEGKRIENGFVLAYGGIEENCTIRAMFDAKKDELSDKVHRILF